MATQKQFEANRRNAEKSTGPKTTDGKAAVRLNALRHRLRARTVVLPGELSEEFQRLCDDLEAEWQPHSRTEQFYLEQMAVAQWKLTRMEVAEMHLVERKKSTKTDVVLLGQLWQQECRLERSYARAQRDLERLQHSRRQPVQQPEEAPPWVVRVQADKEVGESIPGIGNQTIHGPHLSAAYVFQSTHESPSVEEFASDE